MRLDQAASTRAQIVATACPFCLQMLEDAVGAREMGESLRVQDIAELVADSLGAAQDTAVSENSQDVDHERRPE